LLRVDWHRSTMAHLRSVYPFHTDAGFGCRGPYMGVSVTAGMSAFYFDPFELYPAVLTNPNVIVVGEVGSGKSSTVKAFLARSIAVYGDRRFLAVLDPKGEYTTLADTLAIPTVKLHPGGTAQLNPMDPRPGDDPTDAIARQSLAAALVTAVLGRPLDSTEDALLGWAVQTLAATGQPFVLRDVVTAVQNPPAELQAMAQLTPLELGRAASPVVFALDKLCSRTLRGMFDGPTTVGTLWSTGPGIVVDLSAVYGDREALPLVMMAATSWLTAVLQRAADRRVIQVIDEAWAAVRYGARHFQSSLKLARTYGASTWLLCHRPSDLTAQADDGTADAKIAAGLLSDLQTRVLMRQPTDQIPVAAELFALSEREAEIVGQLVRGRALWRLQNRGAVVQQVLTRRELTLFDTDAAMTA
jgi:type IV secretory pathway VirB4 component